MQTSFSRAAALRRAIGKRRHTRPPAFTMIELLVAVGIVSSLLAILIPTVSALNREARVVQCQANLRTLAQGLILYSTTNRGKFPPNMLLPAPGYTWADEARLGRYVALPPPGPADNGRSPYVCPDDRGGARRSYAMNVWASAKVDRFVLTQRPVRGTLWRATDLRSARTALLLEAWSSTGSASAGFRSPAAVGIPETAAKRFGGAGGLRPFSAGRFGRVNCELDYTRHRRSNGRGVEPVGRVSIAFGDGHVELLSNDRLVTAAGALTGACFWSPLDK